MIDLSGVTFTIEFWGRTLLNEYTYFLSVGNSGQPGEVLFIGVTSGGKMICGFTDNDLIGERNIIGTVWYVFDFCLRIFFRATFFQIVNNEFS